MKEKTAPNVRNAERLAATSVRLRTESGRCRQRRPEALQGPGTDQEPGGSGQAREQ